MDQSFIQKYFEENCFGKEDCSAGITVQEMMKKPAMAPGVEAACFDKASLIYLQYQCEQDVDELNVKRVQALFFACTGIFISYTFLSILYYLNKVALIDFKQWDVETVTAGDFTAVYQIPDEVWYNFEIQHEDKTRAEGSDFEDYLKHHFENLVSLQPSVLNPELDPPPRAKIANITFAFNNSKLIKLLKKRGAIVATGNFTKLQAVD